MELRCGVRTAALLAVITGLAACGHVASPSASVAELTSLGERHGAQASAERVLRPLRQLGSATPDPVTRRLSYICHKGRIGYRACHGHRRVGGHDSRRAATRKRMLRRIGPIAADLGMPMPEITEYEVRSYLER